MQSPVKTGSHSVGADAAFKLLFAFVRDEHAVYNADRLLLDGLQVHL